MQRTKLHHNKKQEKRPGPVGAGEVLPKVPQTHTAPRDKVDRSAKSPSFLSRLSLKAPSLGARSRPVPTLAFFRDIQSELRRVTWPSREEANRLTVIVIAVAVAVGLVLGGIDFLFNWIISGVLLR